MSYEALLAEIKTLSKADRLRLADEIRAGAGLEAEEDDFVMTEALARELERRIAKDDANPDDVIPWEVVKAEIEAELRTTAREA